MFDSDKVIDRVRLKKNVKKWRYIAIAAIFLLIIALSSKAVKISPHYIARVSITDVIEENRFRDKALKELSENKAVKAVILYIDSPGGTMVGGENLHESIQNIREKKPVVAVMGSLATSAAYMVASASDHIIAHNGTLTGSIGVLLQTAEVKELAQKLGVNVEVIRSGILKGEPSLFEKMSPETRTSMQSLIDVSHKFFVELVSKNRKIPIEQVIPLADGRVFTGSQALENKLVDSIGSEEDAVNWLKDNKNIKGFEVKDYKVIAPEGGDFNNLLTGLFGTHSLIPETLKLKGLISVWTNTAFSE